VWVEVQELQGQRLYMSQTPSQTKDWSVLIRVLEVRHPNCDQLDAFQIPQFLIFWNLSSWAGLNSIVP
jgi:hypothetical protein